MFYQYANSIGIIIHLNITKVTSGKLLVKCILLVRFSKFINIHLKYDIDAMKNMSCLVAFISEKNTAIVELKQVKHNAMSVKSASTV